jgi:hypothetical protein
MRELNRDAVTMYGQSVRQCMLNLMRRSEHTVVVSMETMNMAMSHDNFLEYISTLENMLFFGNSRLTRWNCMPCSVNTRSVLNLPLTWEVIGIGAFSTAGGLCIIKHSNADATDAIGLPTTSGILVISRVEDPVLLSSPDPSIRF